MSAYYCWTLDQGHTEDDAQFVNAVDAAQAAERYAYLCFSNDDYPDEQRITVREGKCGALSQWTVEWRPSIEFHARPVEDEC